MSLMSTTAINSERLTELLDALPGYAEVTLSAERNSKPFEVRLMARDFPREGRRFTNLTSGTEVFGIGDFVTNFMGMVDDYRKVTVTLAPMTVAV